MKIKESYKGAFVFSKSMSKMIEVKEDNISIFIKDKLNNLLTDDTPKKKRNKPVRDNSKGDSNS